MTTPPFTVRNSPGFIRTLRKLAKRHAELADRYDEAIAILETDPYNRSRTPLRSWKTSLLEKASTACGGALAFSL